MAEPNPRTRGRERFELALDGRQVASIVVGALVVLAVVFLLGLNVGKQLGSRAVEKPRAGDLDALDRAPAPAAKPDPLTFHDRLTQATPPPAPPKEPATPPPAPPPATPVAAAPPAPAPEPARPVEAAAPAPAPKPAASAAKPAASPARPAALKPWTVQLAASEDRREAEKLQARFASLGPRIEEAVVGGKRFYRVRVGSFDTKDAAQKYQRDVARETGAKGIVAPTR